MSREPTKKPDGLVDLSQPPDHLLLGEGVEVGRGEVFLSHLHLCFLRRLFSFWCSVSLPLFGDPIFVQVFCLLKKLEILKKVCKSLLYLNCQQVASLEIFLLRLQNIFLLNLPLLSLNFGFQEIHSLPLSETVCDVF